MNNKVLDIYRPKNETLNDAFDRFVVKIHHQNRMYGHKTFVLTGCEPMVGTTTISINVAISLAMSGLKTILIDGDLRKDGKFKRLGDTLEMGLSDVLSGNMDLASAICATNYITLDYLPSGIKDENPVGLLYSPNLDKVIQSLAEYYDYVIFDLPSANAAIDSNIFASKVDAVILVAGQNSTSTLQIKNAKNELEKIAANLVGIVFNNVDSREYRNYMKNYDYFNKEKFINIKASKEEEEEAISNVVLEDSAFDLGYDQYKDDNIETHKVDDVNVEIPLGQEYVNTVGEEYVEPFVEPTEQAYTDEQMEQYVNEDVYATVYDTSENAADSVMNSVENNIVDEAAGEVEDNIVDDIVGTVDDNIVDNIINNVVDEVVGGVEDNIVDEVVVGVEDNIVDEVVEDIIENIIADELVENTENNTEDDGVKE